MKEQHAGNHTRFVPVFHFIGYPLMLFALVASMVKLYNNYKIGWGLLIPCVLVALSAGLIITATFARIFALKAQDRGIRAEENLRFFAITGSLLDNRLTLKQVIALRFAPNNELLELAHKAVERNLSPRQIKELIVHWRADVHRV